MKRKSIEQRRRIGLVHACRIASFLLLFLAALGAGASQLTVLLDTDNNGNTGCVVPIAGGNFAGAEIVLNTTVNTAASPPVVSGVTRQSCANPATNTLGPPVPVDPGGWPVGLGLGVAGLDVIETYLPELGLPAGTYRLGVTYVDQDIGSDALVTVNGAAGGPPILFALALPEPPPIPALGHSPIPTLGHVGLALLALLLCGAAMFVLRRYPSSPTLVIAVVSIALSTSLLAIVLDGMIADWAGTPPAATDPVGDAPLGADISAFFVKFEPTQGRLYFRGDVKTASRPTAVNDAYSAAAGATLVRPAATGLLANDQLGAPVATLISFGGGNAGGSVVSNAAGTTVPLPVGGSLTVNVDGSFSFTPATGFTGAFVFSYRIGSGAASSDGQVTITVTNALPVVDLNGPLAGIDFGPVAFTEGGGPIAIVDPAQLTVTDADSATLASAMVVITNLLDVGSEFVSVTCPGIAPVCSGAILVADVVYTPATGTLAINRVAPLADYQALLRTLRYDNTSTNPTTTQRDISITVNDGVANNNPLAHATVTVIAVNAAPVLAAIEAAPVNYVENGSAVPITATLTVADSDSPNLVGATVLLTANCASGEDILSFTNQSGISGIYTAASCLLTLTGSATLANYQTALRSVQYSNSSENPSTLARTASFRVDDGAAVNNLSNLVTRAINITAVNDPPLLTAGGTLNYTENDPATVIDGTVTVTDIDSPNLASATVQITGNCANPQDVLSFTNQSGITGVYTPASCLMTLTGSATLASYQTALRSVRYSNSSDNPSTLSRTVTWIGNDATTSSVGVTSTINVTAVNDAPTLALSGSLSYTENQAAASLITSATITDPDSANITGATVQVTGNYVNGQDVLSYVAAPGITGSFNAATGTLTLSGTTTIVNYQTALANVKYANTSENPSTLTRTVTWQVNDGGVANNLSNQPTSTITVTAVNDAPTAFGFAGLPAQAAIPITYPAGKLGGTDPEGAVTIVTTPDTLCTGCSLTINADGSFTFTPPSLAAGTTVQFTYHVTDSGSPPPNLNSPPATVSFTVAGPAIFFVKNPAVGVANCTLGNECLFATAISNIGATANATIFIGDANSHTAGSTLSNGTRVIGQGMTASFDTFFGIVAPAQGTLAARPATNQTRPTVTAASGTTLTLGSSTTLRGFDIGNSAAAGTGLAGTNYGTLVLSELLINTTGAALNLNNGNGTPTFDSITSTGGTNNVVLTSVGGTLTINGGALSGATGDSFKADTGTASITYTGTIASGSAHSVNVTNKTGGTVAFSGIITDTDTGISLTNNTGATISFTGGLNISTGANAAFTATGGGTINVCDENPCNPALTGTLVNTLTTTTATALNVTNTNIGANGLEFRSINSPTASANSGIILNSTGTAGGLKVVGTGTSGTGGTVSNKTVTGVSLTSTAHVNLSYMNITNNGDQIDEGGIRAIDLSGTSSFTNLSVTGSFHANAYVANTTGTLGLTITNSSFNTSQTHDGFHNASDGNSNVTITVANSNFNNNFSDGFDGGVASNSATSTSNISLTTSSFNNNGANGILIYTAGSGDSKFNIFSNTSISGNPSLGINLFQNNGTLSGGKLRGKVNGNTIVYNTANGGGQALLLNAQGAGTSTVEITNNVVNYDRGANTGITIQSGDGITGSTITKVTGNTVNMKGIDLPLRAFNLESGLTAASTRTICLNAGTGASTADNTTVTLDAAAVTVGVEKYRVRKRPNSFFKIQGITPNPSTTAAQVQSYLSSVTGLATSDIFVSGPATFDINYGDAICDTAAAS